MRWDSDHVVLFDDETKEIAREIVRCGGLDGRVKIALDYFDASINRISAWTTGYRNFQKALLFALLQPMDELKKLQDEGAFSALGAARLLGLAADAALGPPAPQVLLVGVPGLRVVQRQLVALGELLGALQCLHDCLHLRVVLVALREQVQP